MIDRTQIVKKNKTIFYLTYVILLAFVVFNYETVFSMLSDILSLATPFYIAIVIAFVLNIPMRKIENLYSKKIKRKGLRRGLSIATTLILALLLIILFSSFIIPRLGESIALIITNIFNYADRLVTMINDALAHFKINYAINYDSIQEALTSLDLNHLLSQSSNILSNAGINLIFQSIGIFGVFINAITSFIMAIYLLANKEAHLRQLKKIVTFIFGYHRSLVILSLIHISS